MYFILQLIILLEIYASTHECKAFVVHTTPQHDNNDNTLSEIQLTQMGVTNPSSYSYIDNMVRPDDIREPESLQEIVNYIGADKLSNTVVMPEPQENQQTLTYTELTNLLAFWQWAKEQNFYEMQTDPVNSNKKLLKVD